MSVLHRNQAAPEPPATTAPPQPAAERDATTADQPTDRPADQLDRPADQPTDRPADQLDRPADQPTDRPADQPTDQPTDRPADRPAAHTRISAVWLGICLAAAVLVVLIIFLLQNTGSVEVSFLWLHGSLPLAIALLIAGVGAALLTMIVGTARITQLRRRFRRTH
jgi:uncharacterized integral membrane protein